MRKLFFFILLFFIEFCEGRYSSSSSKITIYYSTHFDIANNVTGTGNKLADMPYQAICKSLLCSTNCCEGDMNDMVCGTEVSCQEYSNYLKMIKIIIGVCISVGIVCLISLFICCGSKKTNCSDRTVEYFTILGFIIFFPIVFIVLICIGCCKGFKTESPKIEL
jgi:hypothetical protein